MIEKTASKYHSYNRDPLGEELHGDPDAGVHEALDQPGVDVQVSDETHEPDDQEGRSQHHLLPELLREEKETNNGGERTG